MRIAAVPGNSTFGQGGVNTLLKGRAGASIRRVIFRDFVRN